MRWLADQMTLGKMSVDKMPVDEMTGSRLMQKTLELQND
jgi:hypothetical protein